MRSSLLLVVAIISTDIRPSLGKADVVMNVSYENTSYIIRPFEFTLYMFTEFYKCLCKRQNNTCAFSYSEKDYKVHTISSRESQMHDGSTCGLFQCTNSRQFVMVTCTQLSQQQRLCTKPSWISLPGVTTCDFPCVGFDWTFPQEGILFNGSQRKDQHCDDQCCSTTSTTLPNPTPLPDTIQSSNISNSPYKETIIISGVAAGLVFVTVVVVVVILLVKRKKCCDVSKSQNNNLSQRFSTGVVTNAHQEGENNTSRENNRFTQNTNNSHGQSKLTAGLNGALRGQGGRGPSGMAHNTDHNSAAAQAKQHGQFEDVSLTIPNEESEYVSIDEAQVQSGGRFYSISRGGKDTYIGDYTNDGYSSLDSFEYDNTKYTASPCNNTDINGYHNNWKLLQYKFQEKALPRTGNTASGSNEIPEYSVAKSIIDDTDNENEVGAVSSSETSAHTYGREEGTIQPAARPTLDQLGVSDSIDKQPAARPTLDQLGVSDSIDIQPAARPTLDQLGVSDSIDIHDGSKRNPYFELSKEEEDNDNIERDNKSKNPYFELSKEEEDNDNIERDKSKNPYFELSKEEEDNDNIERDNKSKNPYFELSKETEEEDTIERDNKSKNPYFELIKKEEM